MCHIESLGPPGVWGIWGEWLFIFRELGCTGNCFRGAREQAHNFGDVGSLAKNKKNKENMFSKGYPLKAKTAPKN